MSDGGRPRVASRHGLDLAGLFVLAVVGVALGIGWAVATAKPVDTDLYWRAAGSTPLYGVIWGADANSLYVYPPPLSQAIALLHPIGWPLFVATWTILVFLGLWGSLRWWTLPIVAISAAGVAAFGLSSAAATALTGPLIGNIQPLLAAAIVAGFRWPATWAFVILTKIGPGVGVLWFAARREWRNLAIAVAATGLVAAVSFAFAPGLWFDFARFAVTNAATPPPIAVFPVPLWFRLPTAILLILWGARTDRRWTVPIAAGWASLALYDWSMLGIWVAALPLLAATTLPDHAPARIGSR